MITKRWYFTITKGKGKARFTMPMYRKNKKFYITHALHTQMLFTWYQGFWFLFLFMLPGWLKKNGSMFGYKHTTGFVKLNRLSDEFLD